MSALNSRDPWATLPAAQLPNKALQAFRIIAARAPEPISGAALCLMIWPHIDDRSKRKRPNLTTLISRIRDALGLDSVRGGWLDGYWLGIPESRPVAVGTPQRAKIDRSTLPDVPFGERRVETADAMLAALDHAYRARNEARRSRIATP